MPKHSGKVTEILIRVDAIEKELERLNRLWSELNDELQIVREEEREEAGGE